MDLTTLAIPALAMLAVGGAFYALVYPMLSGEAKAEKRITAMQARTPAKLAARVDAAKRRKQVAESLKELDARKKSKKITFETKIAQAGLDWSKPKFYTISGALAAVGGGLAYLVGHNPVGALGVAVVCGLGVPSFVLSSLRKRRIKKFLEELPTAVDIIVRGIKAGIPLGDCLRSIANETRDPLKTEFRTIVEAQAMGLSIADAVERIVDRVPVAEANFFAIVINIQSKAGGNLAEALGNLSNVLRDRKKMKGKVKAMSSEAKASAGIIGSLPPLVAFFVYLTSPDYIKLLFITSTGHMVLAGCAVWMSSGIFMMRKMINFDM